ncbi:MAG: cob(I)yrinic acid a,c-diamide adenosyltransferase [Bifidobacteriaceae bacterium]|jgi:cob(I)alamin adenosyltransferase|nr:cob(I)yrinic acid a,c-diamide adenosyltransferase [Bifidobacteriaceae bacterium]
MVVLSKITTTGGDAGRTHLADMSRVSKADPLIEAVGALAEANAALGVARAAGLAPALDQLAQRLQQECFDVGADLATPLPAAPAGARPSPRAGAALAQGWAAVARDLSEQLGPLRSFALPGGPMPAAQLHLATAVARRAERAAWAAAQARGVDQPGGLNSAALVWLNRISDALFLMARAAACGREELWQPRRGPAGGAQTGSPPVGPASIQDNRPVEAPREISSR